MRQKKKKILITKYIRNIIFILFFTETGNFRNVLGNCYCNELPKMSMNSLSQFVSW